jgi:hypothetical protein
LKERPDTVPRPIEPRKRAATLRGSVNAGAGGQT